MNRQSKILLIIGATMFAFLLVVIFWPAKKVVMEKKVIKTIPASVVIIPTQDKTQVKSTTGALMTILPDDQYKETTLIYMLRRVCPVKNEYFEIVYDYGIDKFIVIVSNENMGTFLQWRNDTGYNFISDKYWQIKTND